MASYDDYGIHLGFCHSQQSFRLLELPQELLDLLTSEDAPVLTLKSSSSPSSAATGPPASHAVLTTQNQTFQLRQVQSSNSIFLLQPHMVCNAGADAFVAASNLSVIAQCKATLELTSIATSPVPYLEELLPLYKGSQDQVDASYIAAPLAAMGEQRSKLNLLADVPISGEEFERRWRDICAFESNGRSMRPSVHSLVEVWRAIMSAATAQGINLGEQFKMDDLWELLEADGCPQPLVKAVIRQLVVEEVDLVNGWMCADRNKSVRWVGATMLEAQGQVSTPVSEFQEAWKNELPEQWRISATLDALKGLFTQPTSTTIRFAVDGSQSTISTASLASARSGSGKAVRKWHEKFKNTRQ